jgi:hypothetical protein
LRELARVTKGRLVATIPHIPDTRVQPLGYWAKDDRQSPAELRARSHFYHVFELSLDDFAAMVSHAGWRVAVSEPLIPFEPMPKWWLIALGRDGTN